jgi:hypothetical protein
LPFVGKAKPAASGLWLEYLGIIGGSSLGLVAVIQSYKNFEKIKHYFDDKKIKKQKKELIQEKNDLTLNLGQKTGIPHLPHLLEWLELRIGDQINLVIDEYLNNQE